MSKTLNTRSTIPIIFVMNCLIGWSEKQKEAIQEAAEKEIATWMKLMRLKWFHQRKQRWFWEGAREGDFSTWCVDTEGLLVNSWTEMHDCWSRFSRDLWWEASKRQSYMFWIAGEHYLLIGMESWPQAKCSRCSWSCSSRLEDWTWPLLQVASEHGTNHDSKCGSWQPSEVEEVNLSMMQQDSGTNPSRAFCWNKGANHWLLQVQDPYIEMRHHRTWLQLWHCMWIFWRLWISRSFQNFANN